jgi:hypothetical protein
MNISRFIKRYTLKAVIVGFASCGGLVMTGATALAAQVNFNTWQGFGDAVRGSGQASLSNNALQNDDFPAPDTSFNFSGTPAGEASISPNLHNFLGVSQSFLDFGDSIALEGSAIKKILTAQAGDVLKFSYNFLTNETAFTEPLNDFAFFLVKNADNNKLVSFNALAFPGAASISSTPYNSQTGFIPASYTFSASGNYTLAFGVVDVDDFNVSSALHIKNANYEPVPEPLTVLGSLTALGFGAGLRQRFRKKA